MRNNYKKTKLINNTDRKFKKTEEYNKKKSGRHYDKQGLTPQSIITQYCMIPPPFLPELLTAHNLNVPGTVGLSKSYQKRLPQGGKISIYIKSFDELSPIEIYNILKIRQDTFILEQKLIYEDIDGKDAHCIHIWCQEERTHNLLAYLRIVPIKEAKKISIGRVLTIQPARGQGISRELMRKGIKFACSYYADYLLTLSAKEKLCPFYKSLGFKKSGQPFFYPKDDPTPIFPMVYVGRTKKVLSFASETKKEKWA